MERLYRTMSVPGKNKRAPTSMVIVVEESDNKTARNTPSLTAAAIDECNYDDPSARKP